MAAETLAPDAILTQTNLTGTLANIATDDTNWLTASSNNADSVLIVSFPTPTGDPDTGAGIQNCTVKYRVTANANTVSFAAYILESGVRLNGGTPVDSWTSASTTEVTREVAWDASLLGTVNGSAVELEVYATKSGGSPANRTTGEFQFVDWDVQYTVPVPNFNGTTTTSLASAVTSTGTAGREGTSAPTASSSTSASETTSRLNSTTTSLVTNVTSTGSLGAQDLSGSTTTSAASAVVSTGQSERSDVVTATAVSNTSSTGEAARSDSTSVSAVSSTSASGAQLTDFTGTTTTSLTTATASLGQSERNDVSLVAVTSNVTSTGQSQRSDTSIITAATGTTATGVASQDDKAGTTLLAQLVALSATGSKATSGSSQLKYGGSGNGQGARPHVGSVFRGVMRG